MISSGMPLGENSNFDGCETLSLAYLKLSVVSQHANKNKHTNGY